MSMFKKAVWLAEVGFMTALAAFSAGSVYAQSPSAAPHQHQAAPPPSVSTTKQVQGSTTVGQDMTSMREKMMADQKAATARLQPLIDTMNAAKGEAKVDAIAAVLTELVHQRSRQMDQMSGMMMPNGMMRMMMEMQAVTGDMHGLAAQCPMMKDSDKRPPEP